MRTQLLSAITTLLVVSALLSACSGRAPQVSSLSVDTLAVWIADGRVVVVLDTRSREDYRRSHIPGAVPAGTHTVSQLRDVLPLEPDVPLVVCDAVGTLDPEVYDLARHAVDIYGFRQVYRLEGGFAAWRAGARPLDGEAVMEP